jgi:hypothetical protein
MLPLLPTLTALLLVGWTGKSEGIREQLCVAYLSHIFCFKSIIHLHFDFKNWAAIRL